MEYKKIKYIPISTIMNWEKRPLSREEIDNLVELLDCLYDAVRQAESMFYQAERLAQHFNKALSPIMKAKKQD